MASRSFSPHYGEKSKLFRNVVVMSLAFMSVLITEGGSFFLNRAYNNDPSVSRYGGAYVAAKIFSGLFLNCFLILKFGCRKTIAITLIGYMMIAALNLGQSNATYFITSFLRGLLLSSGEMSQRVYAVIAAKRYSVLCGKKGQYSPLIIGISFSILYMAQCISNIILATINTSKGSREFPTCYNTTYIDNYCGLNFHFYNGYQDVDDSYTTECAKVSRYSYIISDGVFQGMNSFYIAICAVLLLLVGLIVDPIEIAAPLEAEEAGYINQRKTTKDMILGAIKQVKDLKFLWLTPLCFLTGFSRMSSYANFYWAFYDCPLGPRWMVMMRSIKSAINAATGFSYCFLASIFDTNVIIGIAAFTKLIAGTIIMTVSIYPTNLYRFVFTTILWGTQQILWEILLTVVFAKVFNTHNLVEAFGIADVCYSVVTLFLLFFGPLTSTVVYMKIVLTFVATFVYFYFEYKRRKIEDLYRKNSKKSFDS